MGRAPLHNRLALWLELISRALLLPCFQSAEEGMDAVSAQTSTYSKSEKLNALTAEGVVV